MQRSGSAAIGRVGSIARAGSVRLTKSGTGRFVEEVVVNRNANYMSSPVVWLIYIVAVLLVWLAATAIVQDGGLAWTYVFLIHGAVSYYWLHVLKGSADPEEYGEYAGQTIWDQVDNGMFGTVSRKFYTIMPVLLFLAASHGTELTKQPWGLNLAVLVVLLFAKLPYMAKVRIFGIGAEK